MPWQRRGTGEELTGGASLTTDAALGRLLAHRRRTRGKRPTDEGHHSDTDKRSHSREAVNTDEELADAGGGIVDERSEEESMRIT